MAIMAPEAGIARTTRRSRQRQYASTRAVARASSGKTAETRSTEMTGERASGRATFWAKVPQCKASAPWATIPAPARAPAMEWVVETGSPVREAKRIQTIAPIATAVRKAGPLAGRSRNPLPEKVATRPCEANAATLPPATVQRVPQITAARKLETPLPTSVAIPLETSLDPLAHASRAA